SKFDLDKVTELHRKAAAMVKAAEEKLREVKDIQPKATEIKIARAQLNRDNQKELVKKAEQVVDETRVRAPEKGTVLRVHVAVGAPLGASPKMPAIEFCPDLPLIIRAEVQQEWADRVKDGQACVIEDDITTSPQWKGKVLRTSKWFTHRRSI